MTRRSQMAPTPPRRATLVAIVLILLAGSAPPVRAGESKEEPARTKEDLSADEKESFLKFLEAGREAYSKGEFEKAVPFFEHAYDILPRPEIHYRMALAHERAGNPKEALQYYRRFLEQRPESDKRGQIEQTIGRLEKRVEDRSTAEVRIDSTPTGAKVYIRSAGSAKRELDPRGRTPLTMSLVPGRVDITLEKEDHENVRKLVRVEAGETYNFSYALPRERPEPPPGSGSGSNAVALVATIVGGTGALIGGTLYAVGIHCGRNRKNCSRSLFNTAAIGSYVGGGIGVAGLGTAAVIGLTGGSNATRQSRTDAVRLIVGPTFLGLAGTF